nr:MAG TPA: transposase [Caudoviricetes sp.]
MGWPKEIKEQAIKAYVEGNGDVNVTAREFGIPASTLKDWIAKHWEEEDRRIQEELERKREARAKAAKNRKRRFIKGREVKVVRPTSGSAYITWAK